MLRLTSPCVPVLWIFIVICVHGVCSVAVKNTAANTAAANTAAANTAANKVAKKVMNKDIHGGVKMGEMKPKCDTGKWKIDVDWDNSTNLDYKCQEWEGDFRDAVVDDDVKLECLKPESMPPPIHLCMDRKINYTDIPPRAGTHRPNWPVYGEYLYIPPQRWIHALEHGGVVLVYHPCAHPINIRIMKDVVSECIRRHIITPYRLLPRNKPFAVITYGCRLRVGEPSPKVIDEVAKFIQDTALRTEETNVYKDGHYSAGLIKKARLVSDKYDSGKLCPFFD